MHVIIRIFSNQGMFLSGALVRGGYYLLENVSRRLTVRAVL